jgi:hypothetical protein
MKAEKPPALRRPPGLGVKLVEQTFVTVAGVVVMGVAVLFAPGMVFIALPIGGVLVLSLLFLVVVNATPLGRLYQSAYDKLRHEAWPIDVGPWLAEGAFALIGLIALGYIAFGRDRDSQLLGVVATAAFAIGVATFVGRRREAQALLTQLNLLPDGIRERAIQILWERKTLDQAKADIASLINDAGLHYGYAPRPGDDDKPW